MLNNRDDSKTTTHICMPVLSVIGLMAITLSVNKSQRILYYDTLPRYLRGVNRFLKIPQKKIISILSAFFGMSIQNIKHGEEVPGYRNLHLGAQEVVSTIAEQLIPTLENSKWILHMEKLIGREPSIAYTLKQIANYHIFCQLLPLISCYSSLKEKGNYIAIWDYRWPEEWFGIIKNNLENIEFEFFKWPKWYLLVSKFLFCLFLLPRLLTVSLLYVLKRGIAIKKIDKKHYKIITEFVDPERINNTPYDADYWVDRTNVNTRDILFFLTGEEKRGLMRRGHNIKAILNNVRAKGYEIEDLDNFAYPLRIIKNCLVLSLNLLKNITNAENMLLGDIFLKVWSEYMNFFPLFVYYSSENFIYLTFPNGRTGLRFNSGIITGFCRRNGIRSIGCQTRAIHSRNYEYCFDCFDLYLAWGRVWYEMLGEGMRFIDRTVIVGCIYLDALQLAYLESRGGNEKKFSLKPLNVCIFPSDINMSKHHYTLNYALTFLKNCAKLAIAHRDINFVIKSKEPKYTEIVMSDREFKELYLQAQNNFKFSDRARHKYSDLLSSSDIVIAMGFTTPGAEGLLLSKRVIYYNEIKYGGQAYNKIPDLIARNNDELSTLFEKSLYDYNKYADVISDSLNGLDPFRDAQALRRISKIIIEGVK